MSHTVCPTCRVRFTPADAAGLPSCPVCGGAVDVVTGAQSVIGMALFTPDPNADLLLDAIAAALPADSGHEHDAGPQVS